MGHVDNPKAKKMSPYDKRILFQQQCREFPCQWFMNNNPPCVVCVHEGRVKEMLRK